MVTLAENSARKRTLFCPRLSCASNRHQQYSPFVSLTFDNHLFALVHVPARHHDRGVFDGQHPGRLLAEPRVSARHNDHFVGRRDFAFGVFTGHQVPAIG